MIADRSSTDEESLFIGLAKDFDMSGLIYLGDSDHPDSSEGKLDKAESSCMHCVV